MQQKPLNTLEAGRMAPTPLTAPGVSSGFVTQIGAPVGPILHTGSKFREPKFVKGAWHARVQFY